MEEMQARISELEQLLDKQKKRADAKIKELKDANEELEQKNQKCLKAIHDLKEQIKKISEIAERRGYGKLVDSILEESGLKATIESEEFEVFQRLWQDACRRIKQQNEWAERQGVVNDHQRQEAKQRCRLSLMSLGEGSSPIEDGSTSLRGGYDTGRSTASMRDTLRSGRSAQPGGNRRSLETSHDGGSSSRSSDNLFDGNSSRLAPGPKMQRSDAPSSTDVPSCSDQQPPVLINGLGNPASVAIGTGGWASWASSTVETRHSRDRRPQSSLAHKGHAGNDQRPKSSMRQRPMSSSACLRASSASSISGISGASISGGSMSSLASGPSTSASLGSTSSPISGAARRHGTPVGARRAFGRVSSCQRNLGHSQSAPGELPTLHDTAAPSCDTSGAAARSPSANLHKGRTRRPSTSPVGPAEGAADLVSVCGTSLPVQALQGRPHRHMVAPAAEMM
eukprot:gnl/TRDRNA2_/TRDRNA2_79953_c2_seq1.p1 gnl/TRDRNA2_/TRDRNA2_79953_c2~~gnl/TRDRNA2_/TRDRNA2_79953_c2_seq1.p1  ORF type:complete len:516 (+),score=105.96 gnl/TRDRNA2_/TRDRNA2_79953_c2_seq1:192-1550(+)